MVLNNKWVNSKIKEEVKRYVETSENEKTTIQKSVGHRKTIIRGKFIAFQAYLKKQEKGQINNLTLHLKVLEKEQQTKPKMSRRQI